MGAYFHLLDLLHWGPGRQLFKGETLRGLLLDAYAFGTMGMIAGIAAIAAFIAAAIMLILGGLGLVHARRVSPAAEILGGHPANGRHGQRPRGRIASPIDPCDSGVT